MNECLLHIGTNKTGSTSIQQLLQKNRRNFASQGVLFPKSLGNNGGRFAAMIYADLRSLSRRLFGAETVEDAGALRRRLRGEFEQELAQRPWQRVIFSSEAASAFTPEEILETAEYLRGRFDRVRILAYVRAPLEHVLSDYATQLLHGRRKRLNLQVPPQDFGPTFRAYREAFGAENCVFRPFRREAWLDGDFMTDFLAIAELQSFPVEIPPGKRNTSICLEAQEVTRRLNEFPDGEIPPRNRRALREFLEKNFPGPGYQPSRAEAESFLAQNADLYRTLEEEFLGGFRFPRTDLPYPEAPAAADEAQVLRIALTVLREFMTIAPPPKAAAAFPSPALSEPRLSTTP